MKYLPTIALLAAFPIVASTTSIDMYTQGTQDIIKGARAEDKRIFDMVTDAACKKGAPHCKELITNALNSRIMVATELGKLMQLENQLREQK